MFPISVPFEISIIFAGGAGAHLSGAHHIGLFWKSWLGDRHSSLFVLNVGHNENKLYNIDNGDQYYKTYLFVIYEFS